MLINISWRKIAAFVLLLSTCGFLTLLVLNNYDSSFTKPVSSLGRHSARPKNGGKPRLHLIVPATSSNKYLCQLLLSAALLDYPEPILINWGAAEDENSYIQHLAKVGKVLDYLTSLPLAAADDLALVVDGYDVWLQLPPDVLIQRYYTANEATDRRIQTIYSSAVLKEKGIRQAVIFGPDKLCWPNGDTGERPACWAVPESTLPEHAFGPYLEKISDASHQRPRWLNSGTIIGPIAEVRAVFEATTKEIQRNHTTDSDQFYFANLFGTQEYARRHVQKSPLPDPEGSIAPSLSAGQKTEFHIGIDHEYALFQNVGYSRHNIGWLLYDGSRDIGLLGKHQVPEWYRFDLPSDILASPLPFSILNHSVNHKNILHQRLYEGLPLNHTWRNMPLATNVITRQIPVLLHFSNPKELREQWWDRMWFYPYGERLLAASFERTRDPFPGATSAIAADATRETGPREAAKQERRDGAWSDKGDWISWDALCGAHESLLFGQN